MMNFRATVLLLVPWAVVAGSFTDLDFEGVTSPVTTIGSIPTSQAFPGWTVLLGDVPYMSCLYNAAPLDAASAALLSTFPPRAMPIGTVILAGNYTALLQSSFLGVPATLEQAGTIPAGSQSLTFIGSIGQKLSVSLDGAGVPVVDLGHAATGPASLYDTYAVDVSKLAGQPVTLAFSSLPSPHSGSFLDNISFSPVPIAPEPSTYALFGVGAAALLWFHRRKP